ncbi:MAG: hypothetical protein F4Z31_06160 [Gemmatimonadetes bacterium]|nr:hypothetical protein [Gemmatimonadota bacterium]
MPDIPQHDENETYYNGCCSCVFWKQTNEKGGLCRRYPLPQPFTNANDWCGEWHSDSDPDYRMKT